MLLPCTDCSGAAKSPSDGVSPDTVRHYERLGPITLRELVWLRRRIKAVMKDWDARLAKAKPGERVHLLEALVQED